MTKAPVKVTMVPIKSSGGEMSNLNPIHYSMRLARRLPRNMDRLSVPRELHEAATEMVLSIFTDCINVGTPLQDTLLAIYLSGLQHGQELTLEKE